MWAGFRKSISKDKREMGKSHRSLNVNEEYFQALRTKSYTDFFIKAQYLVNEPSPPACAHPVFSEILLEPGQETITNILESAILSRKSDLKVLSNYFDISAEASILCSQLLKSLNQVQADYQFIHQVLNTINKYPSMQYELLVSELHSCTIFNDPFSNLNKQDFKRIHEKYSSVLQHLKCQRKRVARKIKLVKCFNKASGVCVTAACSLVAVAAMVLAAHTLTALIMGPVLLGLPVKPIKKKLLSIQFLKCGLLRKTREQLDVAAKGTYILNRDFDTMSRLVTRLQDEIEHNKAMIRFCLERREDKLSFQVLKELKKCEIGFRQQVEELEEHVYLCLVTINRARALVIKEISNSYAQNSVH